MAWRLGNDSKAEACEEVREVREMLVEIEVLQCWFIHAMKG